jgi:GMP synthase (glutamine-hydrolysing)
LWTPVRCGQGEAGQVVDVFRRNLGVELIAVNSVYRFMEALRGVIEPEQKRMVIGELFIRSFEGTGPPIEQL